MGKQAKINREANKKLKEMYTSMGIDYCELNLKGCWRNNALSIAHKHKRIWYLKHPELLYALSETIVACVPCHQRIEGNRQLTEEVFTKLRPNASNKTDFNGNSPF